ncbi:MAG: GTPase HflX [Cryobacterium sp.]|nr:GTPase HflX [Oligoflexia bacterium]
MLEANVSLLPKASRDDGRDSLEVVIIGTEDHPLDELVRLLDTLGARVAGSVIASTRKINPATYITRGKLEDVRKLLETTNADGVIVDVELSPNQLRNVEEFLGKPVTDRPGVIIEIFSQHARTKEAKTQTELARLEYVLPRLTHLWSHFERQRGGGTGNRGMGETQIEVDRRLVKKRMSTLRERLKEIEKERHIQRAKRKEVLKVALVGYTNAGKSTLLNALTKSKVHAEDKLFATLDSSVRMLSPDSHPPVVAVDTVGFVSRLPPELVASFRSTLEELHEADLLVHVVDGSSPTAREELEVTIQVMKELDVESKPRITVLNKMDLLRSDTAGAASVLAQSLARRNLARIVAPGSFSLSAFNADEVSHLRDVILEHFKSKLDTYEVVIPYSESKLEALIHKNGSVDHLKHIEKGTYMRVRMDAAWAKKLGIEKYST